MDDDKQCPTSCTIFALPGRWIATDLGDELEHAEQLHPVFAVPSSSSDIFQVRQAPPAAQQIMLSQVMT